MDAAGGGAAAGDAGDDSVRALHEALLDAQRKIKEQEASEIYRELRAGPRFTKQDFEDAVLVRRLEDKLLAQALVILPDSHWTSVHPVRRAGQPDETAVRLEERVVALLQAKEVAGTLFWLGTRPGKGQSFEALSEWIAAMSDPATGNRYASLQLGATWWRRRFPAPRVPPRYTRSGEKVARNVLSTSSEPSSLLELLHQSNPQVFKFMTNAPLVR